MADNSHLVKTLVIRAEDARIMCDYSRMKDTYKSLYGLNSDLIREYSKRANNHAHLMENLKELNSVIQKAARLRIGKQSTKVIAACRKAVKKSNIRALLQIISTGEAPGRWTVLLLMSIIIYYFYKQNIYLCSNTHFIYIVSFIINSFNNKKK